MDHNEQAALAEPSNGVGTSALPPCPLADLPPELHQYIHNLESRLAQVEAEQARFSAALVNAGKFIFDNSMSKPMLAVFPKEMQTKLREFFGR